jgi:hypothetical protein
MSETEYSFFMSQGDSSYKCAECVKAILSSRHENTPILGLRSASTSELPKKLSPEMELILPTLKDPESLSVQIETVRLNGANTNNLVENILQMVLKLTEEVQELRKDNEILKSSLHKIAAAVPVTMEHVCISELCGSSTAATATDIPTQKASASKVPTSAESEVKSYRDVASAGLQSAGQIDSDSFKIMTNEKRSTQVTPVATTVNQRRQPLI